jgi:hypothetical protein
MHPIGFESVPTRYFLFHSFANALNKLLESYIEMRNYHIVTLVLHAHPNPQIEEKQT